MNKSLLVFTAVLLSLVYGPGGTASQRANASTGAEESEFPPLGSLAPDPLTGFQSSFIIKFKATPAQESKHVAELNALTQVEKLSATTGEPLVYERSLSGGAHLIKMTSPDTSEETWLKLVRNADALGIEYIVPNAMRAVALTPNDPQFAQQTNYQSVSAFNYSANLTGAWDIITGSSSIVVAVVDTGVRLDHPDLAGHFLEGYDFVSNTAIANDGDGRDDDPSDLGDWVDETDRTTTGSPLRNCPKRDSLWHGTHVAGIIGASGNNQTGIAGVNWASQILPVRVMGKCGGFDSDIIDGIRWAAGLLVPGTPRNKNPARVINLSLGGWGSCNAAYQTAINDAVDAGAIVVVAAGNASADTIGFTPANCQNVITVGATSRIGNRASYSNYGSAVAISAPGGDSRTDSTDSVLSTVDTGKTTPIASGYKSYDGTSMAAAEVSGIVSLMLSARPALTRDQIQLTLHGSATAFPATSTCTASLCGAGVINAALAVQNVMAARFSKAFMPMATGSAASLVPATEVKISNGDFEQGNQGWVTTSTLGLGNLILPTENLPASIAPHGGKWLAWLGGVNSETSAIEISLTVPADAPVVSFWNRVKSIETDCTQDMASIKINETNMATIGLCTGTATQGWLSRSIDLSDYAGQTVLLKLQATTNPTLASSYFVDDFVFVAK